MFSNKPILTIPNSACMGGLRVFFLLLLFVAFNSQAAEVTKEQIKGLDEQVQDIKKDVLNLSTELARLEEKLLFPSNTQVSLFISMHEGDDFRLDSVQLKLDEKVVAQHLYSFRELEALQSGGVQRLEGAVEAEEVQVVQELLAGVHGDQMHGLSPLKCLHDLLGLTPPPLPGDSAHTLDASEDAPT